MREHGGARRSAAESLIAVIERCLSERTYVLFSGGVDSSLVLSAATTAARRHGVADPIPVTFRHPDHPEADETEYQRSVVRHLGLGDWMVLDVHDELDLLGPTSRRELLTYGPHAFARIPAFAWMLEQLPEPGSLLSGEGGDQVLGGGPRAPLHFARLAMGTRRHRRAAARHLIRWPVDARRRRRSVPIPWLKPDAQRSASEQLRALGAGAGWTMRSALRHHRSKRFVVHLLHELSEQADRYDMVYLAPLLDLDFLVEFTAVVPDRDFLNRSLTLARHFPGMVPDDVARRVTKAEFRSSVNGEHTRAFAREWDGRGVPLDLVDPDALRRAWLDGSDARSWLLLQHAWLASEQAS